MKWTSTTLLFLLISCTVEESNEQLDDQNEPIAEEPMVDYNAIPTFSESGRVNAVIEIPAGTNDKVEFIEKRGQFEITRVINYMPYPANYGFIPGTYMNPAEGGDGDALDIIVLAPYQPTGTIMEVVIIGSLDLLDHGEVDNKIIAVPADSEKNLIDAWTLADLPVEVMLQLENWFTNYKEPGIVEFVGWQKEDVALADVTKWSK